jgi:enolase-phosphatase E1
VASRVDEFNIRVILLDIEGTTTPVDFVYKTLFPYAHREVEAFLLEHLREAEMKSLLAEFAEQHRRDARKGTNPPEWREDTDAARMHSAISYVKWLMAQDSKCTALKSLQGRIWQQGYARGELRGEVYPDVPDAFKRWRKQGREICIYSSGSILAQQLLFRTCVEGDLTQYISAFFDTGIGAKGDSTSYHRIAESCGRPAGDVLFISDASKEVEAARIAGMQTHLCVRSSSALIETSDYSINTFSGILPD